MTSFWGLRTGISLGPAGTEVERPSAALPYTHTSGFGMASVAIGSAPPKVLIVVTESRAYESSLGQMVSMNPLMSCRVSGFVSGISS